MYQCRVDVVEKPRAGTLPSACRAPISSLSTALSTWGLEPVRHRTPKRCRRDGTTHRPEKWTKERMELAGTPAPSSAHTPALRRRSSPRLARAPAQRRRSAPSTPALSWLKLWRPSQPPPASPLLFTGVGTPDTCTARPSRNTNDTASSKPIAQLQGGICVAQPDLLVDEAVQSEPQAPLCFHHRRDPQPDSTATLMSEQHIDKQMRSKRKE